MAVDHPWPLRWTSADDQGEFFDLPKSIAERAPQDIVGFAGIASDLAECEADPTRVLGLVC